MPTIHKKVFSVAPVKRFFLKDSNNADSMLFGDAILERSKITV